MEVFAYIGIIAILGFILLAINGKLSQISVLISGFMSTFVQDITKTPDGAEAVYNKAIEDAQRDVDDIKIIYGDICGYTQALKNDTEMMRKKSAQIVNQLELCANKPGFNENDMALLALAEEKITLDDSIIGNDKALQTVNAKVAEIDDILQLAEKNLLQLKADKKKTLNDLKRNSKLEQIYNASNKLTSDSTSRKMIEIVKEGVAESSAKAYGAKVIHDTSLTTKIDKLHKQTIVSEAYQYLKSLKK